MKFHSFTFRTVLLLLFIFSVRGFGQGASDALTDSVKMDYEFYRLKNGLQILLHPDRNVENVSVEVWLKTGIRDEAPDKHGFVHFFEHVTSFGLRDSPKERKLLRNYRTGSNAQVRKDFIRYFTEVKPVGLNLALKYTADRFNAEPGDITEKRVENERKRVLREIERNSKNPFWSAAGGAVFHKATFGKEHPYGHSGYGLIENNKNFRLEEFRDWYSRYVHPENIILFVVGNFNRNRAKQLIEKYFGKISKNKTLTKGKTISPATQSGKEFAVAIGGKENYLVLCWAVPGWGSEEDGALRLVANILDKRLKAKAPAEVLKMSALDYFDMFEHNGRFVVYASFSNQSDKTKIERVLGSEIKKLVAQGITEEEIKSARQNEIANILEMKKNLGFQFSRTELLGEGLLFKNDPGFYLKRLKAQRKLGKEEIEKIIKSRLGSKPSKIFFRTE